MVVALLMRQPGCRKVAQDMPAEELNRDRSRRYWDKESASYDKQMQLFERLLAPDSRAWVCSQAAGNTLEVGMGTGLNLPLYPGEISLTGIDFSPAMLGRSHRRRSVADTAHTAPH
jgi:hypothetical protein